MIFGASIFNFYNSIVVPEIRSDDVQVLLPFETPEVREINKIFYNKYYNDTNSRIFLIGINPGRFGGGITGIPFTDPVNLQNILGIPNSLAKKHELSSQFVYKVIDGIGGPHIFFGTFYLTAVSPVGFVLNNKNVNYYDIKQIKNGWEMFFVESIKAQIKAGGNTDIAFILGQGENSKYLTGLNDKYHLFGEMLPLPHPRWIMQYRYMRRNEFVYQYVNSLKRYL
jgi:hypothetical protein